jgi:hypothetical protein
MANWDLSVEDYQSMWDGWYKDYGIDEFIEYSEENWEKVQKMDSRLVWTNHSTCEDEQVTAGAAVYRNSCCWDTFGWYIAKNPWDGEVDNHYESYNASAYLPCSVCNPGGEGDEENYDLECEECEGDGFATHYFD